MPTGLLINDSAAALSRDPALADRMVAALGPSGLVRRTAAAHDAAAAVEGFRRRGVDLICILGGDGTTLSVLTAVVRSYPAGDLPLIGILRGGTINTLAKYFGISGRPDRLLKRIAAHRAHDRRLPVRRLQVLHVGDRFGVTFGAASMGRFYDEYNQLETIDRLSVTGYVARVALSTLFGTSRGGRLLAPVPARIAIDGVAIPIPAFTVIVASCMEDHGFGVRPTYRGSSQPGRFQLLASAKGAGRIARQVHRLLLGRPFTGDDHFDGMAREVRISFARPETCMIDGEVFEAQEVILRAGPTMRFVG